MSIPKFFFFLWWKGNQTIEWWFKMNNYFIHKSIIMFYTSMSNAIDITIFTTVESISLYRFLSEPTTGITFLPTNNNGSS